MLEPSVGLDLKRICTSFYVMLAGINVPRKLKHRCQSLSSGSIPLWNCFLIARSPAY